ncbi:hypothetical protein M409DRAFT_23629 [Zasmidium cellare ATCC 36951]|uniref:Uncharacterized protein n=1 Tax=Zasmidium cellare ATCC 36951 TaxID=1080233 RepID=A0A6A6CF88_ZASCE|nr:uncharacterized protein M409DRAFT_23629 [Zasmidium cellare ATCC 36951]KAF2165897.1 hypothetical protein M409DRAFT_23629 [Zasmidium cellare ATCC 36951]
MKLFSSVYSRQEKRINELEQALEQANATIAHLRAENAGHPTARRDSAYSSTRASSRAPSTSPAPSYSRPTAASARKPLTVIDPVVSTKHPANSATVHGIRYYYVDGCIAEQERSGRNTGYLKHTRSSARKASHPERALDDGITYTTRLREDMERWDSSTPEPEDNDSNWGRVDDEPEYLRLEDGSLDEVASLKKTTRLNDEDFYKTQQGQVGIRFDHQMHSLREAFELAQDALFDAARERWPETWRRFFIAGPRSIRFGRDELYGTILGEGGSRFVHGVHISPGYEVASSLLEVVYLRNAVAHPGPKKTCDIDKLMAHAQRLACALQDKTRARKIRQCRDDLQEKAKASFEEIVAYEPWSRLPEQGPWQPHHQGFFTRVNARHGKTEEEIVETYGAAAMRAAAAWDLLCQDVGQDDPVYLASIEKQDAECAELAAKTATEAEA